MSKYNPTFCNLKSMCNLAFIFYQKNIFSGKMDLRLFYFHVTIYTFAKSSPSISMSGQAYSRLCLFAIIVWLFVFDYCI